MSSVESLTKYSKYIEKNGIVLYECLLDAYIKESQVEKAFKLWSEIEERGLLVTDIFCQKLGKFMKYHNKHLPFMQTEDFSLNSNYKDELNKFLENKNLQNSIQNLAIFLKERDFVINPNPSSQSFVKIIQIFFENLSLAGDVETLCNLEKVSLSKELQIKRIFSLIAAYSNSGRTQECITLLKDIPRLSSEKEWHLPYLLNFDNISYILTNDNENKDCLKTLTEDENFIAIGYSTNIYANIFFHHIYNKNSDAATETLQKYFSQSEKLDLNFICNKAKTDIRKDVLLYLLDNLDTFSIQNYSEKIKNTLSDME